MEACRRSRRAVHNQRDLSWALPIRPRGRVARRADSLCRHPAGTDQPRRLHPLDRRYDACRHQHRSDAGCRHWRNRRHPAAGRGSRLAFDLHLRPPRIHVQTISEGRRIATMDCDAVGRSTRGSRNRGFGVGGARCARGSAPPARFGDLPSAGEVASRRRSLGIGHCSSGQPRRALHLRRR